MTPDVTPEAGAGTLGVTGKTLSRWAIDILRTWLPGATGIDEDLAAEFRIRFLGPQPRYEQVERYEVTTVEGHDPRVFRLVVLAVEEEP